MQMPRCTVTLSGTITQQWEPDEAVPLCLHKPITNWIPLEQWLKIVAAAKTQGTVKLRYVAKPIGRDQVLTINARWQFQDDCLHGTLLVADPVTAITAIADNRTDSCSKLGQNDNINLSVPDLMTPELLRLAAQNAFKRLPLLTHKEILERSVLEPSDKIRIYCTSKEDAIALHEGRWDIAECAFLLYPQTNFEFYYQVKDQVPCLYKAFSAKEALLAGRLQRREVQNMIEQVNGNGHKKELLLPGDLTFTEIYNSILHSPDVMTLVTEAESKPIIVSRQYAKLTEKTISYWVGAGSINKAGWAPGELEKMQTYLERDGFLQNYEYKAYLHDYDEVTNWYTSFQRIFCDGEWMRIAKVLDIAKANMTVV
jgi:hypothetical protein